MRRLTSSGLNVTNEIIKRKKAYFMKNNWNDFLMDPMFSARIRRLELVRSENKKSKGLSASKRSGPILFQQLSFP